jgi:choline kinase
MRITSAEVKPVSLSSDLKAKETQSLAKREDTKHNQFIEAVADYIYTQRAFIKAIRAKGNKLDIEV